MAKRKFTLTEQDAQALQVRYDQSRKSATRSRYQAVWMYGSGYPVAKIEKLVGCSRSSLMNWCRTYQTDGAEGLEDKRLGGNSTKLSSAQREDLKSRLQSYTPAMMFGAQSVTKDGQFWTVADIQQAVEAWYGVTYRSRNSYRQLLVSSGFSYQRPSKVAEFEEEFEKKSSTSFKVRPKR